MLRFHLKLFFRHFSRHIFFNIFNMAGLAIGMAAVIIIGSWIHFHLTFNRSLENADRLFRVIQHLHYDQADEWVAPTPTPLAVALMQTFPEISRVCRIHPSEDLILKTEDKSFSENRVIFADSTLFDLFPFEFSGGRDSGVPAKNETVISETTAKKYFGTENPLGKMMLVDEHEVFVAGVFRDLPPNTHFDFQVVLPLELAVELHHEVAMDVWNTYDEVETYIKTAPHVDMEELSEKIVAFKANFVEDSQDELILQPVKKIHTNTSLNYDVAKTIDPAVIFTFSSIALFLLIISISNFIIFTTAQSTRMTTEIAIRKINGSLPRNIIAGQILESFLLVFLSAVISLILVELFSPLMQRYIDLPHTGSFIIQPDILMGLIFLIGFISLTGGLANGLRLNNIKSRSMFRTLSQRHIRGKKLLRFLVILQFSISMIMLVFAYTIHAQLRFIENKDVGFDKDRLISVKLFDESKLKLFDNLDQFLNELKSCPAIQDATFSCSSPAIINTSAGEAGWDGKRAGESLTVQWNSIFYNYFQTIGVDVVAGRNFSDNFQDETGGDEYSVYILNESAVKGMGLTNEEALGRNFELYGRKGPIIGIVRDFHFKSLHEEIPPMAFDMLPWWYNDIIIRTSAGSPPPLQEIEKIYKKYTGTAPFQFSFIADDYNKIYEPEKKLLSYHSLLSLLMLLISILGLSSLAFLILENRTKEIGIRKVNGASIADIFRLLIGYFGRWLFVASIVAMPIAAWMVDLWLKEFAFRTMIRTRFFVFPLIFVGVLSLLSVLIQVFRAARTNPVEVLRQE